jgi:hypothetical protein
MLSVAGHVIAKYFYLTASPGISLRLTINHYMFYIECSITISAGIAMQKEY